MNRAILSNCLDERLYAGELNRGVSRRNHANQACTS